MTEDELARRIINVTDEIEEITKFLPTSNLDNKWGILNVFTNFLKFWEIELKKTERK